MNRGHIAHKDRGPRGPRGFEGATGAAGSAHTDRVVPTATTLTIANQHSLVVVAYLAVQGTGELVIEGDGALAVIG